MGKEFKEWDKRLKGSELKFEFTKADRKRISRILGWNFREQFKYSQADVMDAVYNADDVADWQLFRVSLKGLSTHEKLFLLAQRYRKGWMQDKNKIEYIRVWNYIGALKRGGQLDSNLMVVK